MVRIGVLTGVLGQFLGMLSASMLVPLILSFSENADNPKPLAGAIAITAAAALALMISGRRMKNTDLQSRAKVQTLFIDRP